MILVVADFDCIRSLLELHKNNFRPIYCSETTLGIWMTNEMNATYSLPRSAKFAVHPVNYLQPLECPSSQQHSLLSRPPLNLHPVSGVRLFVSAVPAVLIGVSKPPGFRVLHTVEEAAVFSVMGEVC